MRIIIGSPDPSFDPIELETETKNTFNHKFFEKEYYDINDEKLPAKLYFYAIHVIRGRWPKAEPIIMKEVYYAFYYARDMIRGRWPEAEPIIMQNPEYAYYYAVSIMRKRWPEAEPIIMQSLWAKQYNEFIQ